MNTMAFKNLLTGLLSLAILFTSGCGAASHPASATRTYTDLSGLSERYSLYSSMSPRGWDLAEGCDSLLFVTLSQVGLGESGPVEEAKKPSGQWFRLPAPSYAATCDSDISRDMLMGLVTWMFYNKRLDLAVELWDFGRSHGWQMGQERADRPETRTIMTPNMIALLADVILALGGDDHPERRIPAIYDVNPGFTSHLTLLHLNLLGETRGYLTARELTTLRSIQVHMGKNPLVHYLIHRYTDGDQSEAVSLLLSIWPDGRLPTHADWSEAWRLQRSDDDTGLQPGDPTNEKPHTGGDFLFVAKLLLDSAA